MVNREISKETATNLTHDASREQKKASDDNPGLICRPIQDIMTNYGYALPDPNVPNRLSIWFTGGTLEVNDHQRDLIEWKRIFNMRSAPKRNLKEWATDLAARVLIGAHVPDKMQDDGTMSYTIKRPIGSHGLAFCDVLYMDDTLRIMKDHNNTLYIFARITSCVSADEEPST
eukprot:scaffold115776_cov53-Attheya_sp.AAC.2